MEGISPLDLMREIFGVEFQVFESELHDSYEIKLQYNIAMRIDKHTLVWSDNYHARSVNTFRMYRDQFLLKLKSDVQQLLTRYLGAGASIFEEDEYVYKTEDGYEIPTLFSGRISGFIPDPQDPDWRTAYEKMQRKTFSLQDVRRLEGNTGEDRERSV